MRGTTPPSQKRTNKFKNVKFPSDKASAHARSAHSTVNTARDCSQEAIAREIDRGRPPGTTPAHKASAHARTTQPQKCDENSPSHPKRTSKMRKRLRRRLRRLLLPTCAGTATPKAGTHTCAKTPSRCDTRTRAGNPHSEAQAVNKRTRPRRLPRSAGTHTCTRSATRHTRTCPGGPPPDKAHAASKRKSLRQLLRTALSKARDKHTANAKRTQTILHAAKSQAYTALRASTTSSPVMNAVIDTGASQNVHPDENVLRAPKPSRVSGVRGVSGKRTKVHTQGT